MQNCNPVVLVADDNAEMAVLVRAYSQHLPIELEFAENGREAVEMRQLKKYDLVLMDVHMPVMDGCAATREIRAWEQSSGTARIPIVALTADESSQGETLQAGCDAHVTKPVEQQELVAVISKYTEQTGDPATNAAKMIAARRPSFLQNRKRDALAMRESLSAGDFASVQSVSHKCKGTGTGYGFPEITRIAGLIESAARAHDGTTVESALSQFEAYVEGVS